MDFTANRELVLSRAYEHALRSAYAHGSTLTDFSFSLPQPDDVLVFPNGNKALRMDTHDSGYSDDELHAHAVLMRYMGAEDVPLLRVPDAFAHDTDTILEMHVNDLSEIAHGLVRDAQKEAEDVPPLRIPATLSVTFATFARASLAFHEALLHATDALLSFHEAEHATHLMHSTLLPNGSRGPSLLETLLQAEETLGLATRRLRHSHLTHVLETGSHAQLVAFFSSGKELGIDSDFFAHHLERL